MPLPPLLCAEITRISPPYWDLCFVLAWFWFSEAGCHDSEPLILLPLFPNAEITWPGVTLLVCF